MRLLLDTHLLLWAAEKPTRLSAAALNLMKDAGNQLMFSAASFWEIAIKRGLGRDDFQVDPRSMRRGLLDNHYSELLIGSDHAIAIDALPRLHKDPFDRILIAQAMVEGITLLTTDPLLAQYAGPVRRV